MTRKASKSFSSAALKNRLRKVDNAVKKEDWFSAFASIVTYFEHFGYWAVTFYCRRNKMTLTKKALETLRRFGAADLAFLLRILNLMDNETYSTMKKTIEERNKIVHPGQRGIKYVDKKSKEEASRLLNEAKECFKTIMHTQGYQKQ
jgi:hypothetical protein